MRQATSQRAQQRLRRKPYIQQFYRGNRPLVALCLLIRLAMVAANLALSWGMQQLIDLAASGGARFTLGQVAAMNGLLLAAMVGVSALSYAVGPLLYRRAMGQYRDYAFRRITQKGVNAFAQESTATYLSALTSDAAAIETGYLKCLVDLPGQLLLFAGSFGLMLWYSLPLTLGAAVLAALPLAASLLAGGRLAGRERALSDENERFLRMLKELLTGFSVIKSFGAEQAVFGLFARSNGQVQAAKCRRDRTRSAISNISSIAGAAAQLGIMLLGVWLALRSTGVTAGITIVFVQLIGLALDPIQQIPQLWADRRAALALIDKLAAALECQPQPGGTPAPAALRQGIRLENLSFCYTPGAPALQNLCYTFEAGKCYAIVGGSGSGKSTLLQLLMGGLRGYTGSLLYDGRQISSFLPDSLFRLISVIQQSVFLFDGMLRDNLTLFSAVPDAQLAGAVQQAGLGALVAARGLDTACGEGGQNLSGGERQRVAIARSLLRQTPVLLADEATAALDAATSCEVTQALLDLEGVTRILVTHRLEEKLLRQYDGILVLKNGRLAESGTFAALMAQKGYFYSLFTVAQ